MPEGRRTGRGSGGRAHAVVVLALGLAVLAAAVLVAATVGPVPRDAAWSGAVPVPTPEVTGTLDVSPMPAASGPEQEPTATVDLSPQVLTVVLLGALAALVVALVLRAARRGAGFHPEPAVGHRPEGPLPVGAPLARVAREQADVLRRADPRTSRDAVVACWLRLEDAAAAAGAPRRPEQTATRFTAGVLERLTDDRDAVGELLGLYHRARFGSSPLPDDAAARAAGALDRIVGARP